MSPYFASCFLNDSLNSISLVYPLFSLSSYCLYDSSLLSTFSLSLPCSYFTYLISAFSSLWLGLTNLKSWTPPSILCVLGCMDSFTISLTSHTYPPYPPHTCMLKFKNSAFMKQVLSISLSLPKHELPEIYITLHTIWLTSRATQVLHNIIHIWKDKTYKHLWVFLTQFGRVFSISSVRYGI